MDLNTDKIRAFTKTMAGFLDGASAAMMISIGHKVGLFDVMSTMAPSTSPEIADLTGLHERYVREWLGAMAAAGVIVYKSASDTYVLPPEHAAILTRAAGPRNLALQMQFIAQLGTVEDRVAACFRDGGGVPYSEYDDFHRVMADVSGARYDETLVSSVLPLVPGALDALSHGIDVADVGCGSGHAVNVMARAFPDSTFTGYDIADAALATGRAEADAWGLTNVDFVTRDVAALCENERFDLITTFDAIHDQAHPRTVVAGIHAALKRQSHWLCVDIRASSHVGENLDLPVATFGYTVSCMHCMTVSLAYDGDGLGAMWGVQQARSMFLDAGFTDITIHNLDTDPGNNYYVCSRS